MNINRAVFENVKQHGAKVLCVTKYWEEDLTNEILDFGLREYPDFFLGVGENRTVGLEQKNLPRDKTHFVGNLQSRNLREVVRNTKTIHSLQKFAHFQKIQTLCELGGFSVDVFLQVNISQEPQKNGILPEEFPAFLEALEDVREDRFIRLLGISAIGIGTFTLEEKQAEFRALKKLRDVYLPEGKISAGTSRDYEIALGEGIDIVRVGKALIEEDA